MPFSHRPVDLDNLAYPDITLRIGTKTLAVHKYVLHTKSGFFRAALKQSFSETQKDYTELVGEDDLDMFWIMIQFMYCDNYDAIMAEYWETYGYMLHAYLFRLGDSYDVADLVSVIEEYLKDDGPTFNEDCAAVKDTLAPALEIFWSLPESITKGVRHALLVQVCEYLDDILDRPGAFDAFKQQPQIALDIITLCRSEFASIELVERICTGCTYNFFTRLEDIPDGALRCPKCHGRVQSNVYLLHAIQDRRILPEGP